MVQQTAVEWLIDQLIDMEYDLRLIPNTIRKAIEIEKRQHAETWNEAQINYDDNCSVLKQMTFEQYYNETYKAEL